MNKLQNIKNFILDLDGTFYLGNNLLPGAVEFLKTLQEQNKDLIFLTNNSSKDRISYKNKLLNLGCTIDQNKIFTSGEATTIYINRIKQAANIFLLGTPELENEFITSGIGVSDDVLENFNFVVLGFDLTLTYNKIWKACDLIRKGVPYIATHPDINCPLEGNNVMPDVGAIIELIYASTGKRPYIIGKPNLEIINSVFSKYNFKKEETAIVGDRLYTDIQTGINCGITSILVLSGETDITMYKNSDIKADYVFNSIKELNNELLMEG